MQIASGNATSYSIIYIYEEEQNKPKTTNRFADSFNNVSLHLGILFQIYGPAFRNFYIIVSIGTFGRSFLRNKNMLCKVLNFSLVKTDGLTSEEKRICLIKMCFRLNSLFLQNNKSFQIKTNEQAIRIYCLSLIHI